MNPVLLDAFALPEDADTPGDRLPRTHARAMAALAFTLQWNSAEARHTDCLVARKLNLWRDILPPGMEHELLDQPLGHEASRLFGAGELVPEYREDHCLRVPNDAFNRRLRRRHIEPRSGRFYPKGFMAGVKGLFPEDGTPFRMVEVADTALTLDLNHPLAAGDIRLDARILDVWAAKEEHGGACHDVAEMLTLNGPGMQARWRGRRTDFWSELPFARLDPTPDEAFYAKPRMVQHLDATALDQVSRLYGRLIPRGARILDLMSSWTSHLPPELAPTRVAGLGMNAEELDANEVLTERIVHDLNLQPLLPFAAESFDAALCTVSVEYLTKPLEVFAEVCRVLRPGGRFVVVFSDRWFPPKVVKIWQDVHEFERLGLVLEYFLEAGGFANLETWSLRGLPRPANDKYAVQRAQSDPLYAVWGERAR